MYTHCTHVALSHANTSSEALLPVDAWNNKTGPRFRSAELPERKDSKQLYKSKYRASNGLSYQNFGLHVYTIEPHGYLRLKLLGMMARRSFGSLFVWLHKTKSSHTLLAGSNLRNGKPVEEQESSVPQRVHLDCQYGIRAQKSYHIWLLVPNSILAVYLDPLGSAAVY